MKYGIFDHMDYGGTQTPADFFENRLKLANSTTSRGTMLIIWLSIMRPAGHVAVAKCISVCAAQRTTDVAFWSSGYACRFITRLGY